MARDSMIELYLGAFGARVGPRADRSDLIDEVRDHLLSASERLQAQGADRATAERRALARFGDPYLVASLITRNPSKRAVVPFVMSRYMWVLAGIAAVAWLAAGVSSLWGFTELFVWTRAEYAVAGTLLGIACFATTAVLVGANIRLVGRFDRTTGWITGLALFAGLVCSAGLAWVIGAWVVPLAVAVIWTLSRGTESVRTPAPLRVALAVAMRVLAVAALIVTVISVTGQVDGDWAVLA